jgi:hypothetical protein
MKKLYTFLASVITIITFAQAPQGFNYQATVRNSAGNLIVNQNVNFKFNIMLNSATSVPVFSETHFAPTDDLGQVNLIIGQGTATTGNFSTINWGTGNYFLGIELNTGSGYVAMGTTQLLSVPFALYANSAGNSQSSIPTLASVLAVNNSANNTKITNLADPTNAQDAVTKGYLDNLDNSKWLKNGNNVYYNSGNVGIGTSNPTFGLEVMSNSLEARRGILMAHYTDNNNASQFMLSKYRGSFTQPQNVQNADYTGTLIFTAYNGQTSTTELPTGSALIGSRISGNVTSNYVPQDLYFATGNSTTQTDPYQQNTVRMVVSHNGNVGIGTTTPLRTLHVNSVMRLEPVASSPSNPSKGDMYFDGTLNKLRVYDGSAWQNVSDTQASTPIVTTSAITSITNNSALTGGNVSSQGGSIVTARGICYSTSPNPTLSNSFTTNSAGTGTFTSNLTGLLPNTIYYIRAYATNSFGTSYGSQITFTTLITPSVSIGQSYQGGIVGYIYQPGDNGYVAGETHGIIASTADLSSGIVWSNSASTVTGSTGTALGTGSTNTTLIVTTIGNSYSYAAKICYDLVQGGYNDWFLPSRDELLKLYLNRASIGGFTTNYYWSSSKDGVDGTWDWVVGFSVGDTYSTPNTNTNYVRAVRYF